MCPRRFRSLKVSGKQARLARSVRRGRYYRSMAGKNRLLLSALAALSAFAAVPVHSQFPHPGCPALKAADFRKTVVLSRVAEAGSATDATLKEPVQMDLHGVKGPDGKVRHVDIYFVQRADGPSGAGGVDASVKRFDGATSKVGVVGKLRVWGRYDSGLMGIALDPGFDANRRLYLWYIPPVPNSSSPRRMRLSRFSLKADYTLDMASEKNLLDIPGAATDEYHNGGPMHFDAHGDLWIQVGNNSNDLDVNGSQFSRDSTTSDEWGPSNTASLRGGTLRIHPDDSPKGYSIPAGNFGEYWARQFESQGRPDSLVAQYRNPARVRPEIYVKGERSNYSISVHPTKRWLAWGTVNFEQGWEEFNITATPAFTGFPYFHGNNVATPAFGLFYDFVQRPGEPVNRSTLSTGVRELPPALPGAVNGLGKVVIGGPIYVFDPGLDSRTKFPPQMHNTWITMDFVGTANHPLWIHNLDSATLRVTQTTAAHAAAGLFAGINMRRPVQAKYGPEGALYILNYDGRYDTVEPSIFRVDHVGACSVAVSSRPRPPAGPALSLTLSPTHLVVHEAGRHELEIRDLAGNRRAVLAGGQGARYSLPDLRKRFALGNGIHIARVSTSRGTALRQISLL